LAHYQNGLTEHSIQNVVERTRSNFLSYSMTIILEA